MSIVRTLLTFVFVLGWCNHPARAIEPPKNRKALIIANADYLHLEKLPAAKSDGIAVRKFLTDLKDRPYDDPSQRNNFRLNVTKNAFFDHWRTFLDGLDGDTLAVFYFSGHGKEIDGDNYLIPYDMQSGLSDPEVVLSAISVKRLLAEFKARQAVVEKRRGTLALHGIFIIDACRDRSKDVELASARPGGKSIDNEIPGLSPLVPPPGIFIMYAAGPGEIAQSKLGASDRVKLSVYTRLLLPHLRKGLSLSDAARRVRREVFLNVQRIHRKRQMPAYLDELSVAEAWTINGIEAKSDLSAPQKPEPENPVGLTKGSIIWECDDCPEMVVVPPGQFMIGSPREEPGRDPSEDSDETGGKRQRIAFTKPFAVARHEVTRGQWGAYLRATRKDCTSRELCRPSAPDKPVSSITWDEARAYATWLDEHTRSAIKAVDGKLVGPRYRLMYEAEWEYAARAGAEGRYAFGEDAAALCAYANGADASLKSVLWTNTRCDDGKARDVAQAGSYKPNAFGLYDMHGNVWEWVADCWSDTHRGRDPDGVSTSRAPVAGKDCERVARGGSWRSGPDALRSAKRLSFPHGHARPTLGFRVMRMLTEAELATYGK